VEPGDQLVLTAQVERYLKGIWRFSTTALIGDNEVAHADIMVAPETAK
jgi:3-hydroxyacyl-[acyl-carrier-protein] dehydratase